MKAIYKFFTVLALSAAALTSLTSCMDDFGDINVNPNYPTDEYTDMLFTFSAKYIRYFIMTSSSYDPWMQEYAAYIAEAKNNQYGPLTTTVQFGSSSYYYYPIKNLNSIISLNQDERSKNESNVVSFGSSENQIATAMTLRAFFYMSMSDILGPLAYSEAFQGDDGNFTPKYDSQEDIYAALDEELQEAYDMFDETGSLTSADIIYDGDISKWKKFNATLRMMMAIKLADVAPTAGASRFAQAYADGGMESNSDSFCYTFDTYTKSWFYSIGNESYSARSNYFGPNKVLVDYLKEYKDPRLFRYTALNGYLGDRRYSTVTDEATGTSSTVRTGYEYDFDSYNGLRHGLETNDAVTNEMGQAVSVHSRYCEEDATYGLITYARSLLVEAEAAVRGWISADAKTLYEAGITASFDFEGVNQVAGDTDDAGNVCPTLAEYLASSDVAFASSSDQQLMQIFLQRYLAGFLCDGVEAWSDWRRSSNLTAAGTNGIPVIPMYAGQTAQGYTSYPCRMRFSDNDRLYNEENYEEMNTTWFGGTDDTDAGRWARVWWDTTDNTCPDYSSL